MIKFIRDNINEWWMGPLIATAISVSCIIIGVYGCATLLFMEATPFTVGSAIITFLIALAGFVGLIVSSFKWFD